MNLEELIFLARSVRDEASNLGLKEENGTDARDHLMQAHFRMTEAVAHLLVAKGDLSNRLK